MNIPIENVNVFYRVLIAIGAFMGLFLGGCSNHISVDAPAASMGSASDIKEKLGTTHALRGTDIKVNTRNGKNILSGMVRTKKQKFLAGSVARSVKGSGIVVNQLVVQ